MRSEKEMKSPSAVLWFGKEVECEDVKKVLAALRKKGISVLAPFYIGYKIDSEIVTKYLEESVDASDSLYIIGEEGSILDHIVDYATEKGKDIVYLSSKGRYAWLS